ncbi:ABC transporter ATP-binding protein [Candidatus Babeliales bacterium]|nr:ABC transporter ATP-binding protein [Candidatus Babeliales bacterium]
MKGLTILKLQNITHTFHKDASSNTILNNVSYTFLSGQSYAIMGPSGIGKSTLLHLLAGLQTPTSGSVWINGQNICDMPFEKRMNYTYKYVGLVFQQANLISELNVIENVMLSAITQNQMNDNATQKALDLLMDVNLLDKAYASPNTLSGGQQQRVSILRALFHAPSFLIADEPTGNLDSATAQIIMNIIQMYQKKYSMGLIISTHDPKIASVCDTVLQIKNNQLQDITQNAYQHASLGTMQQSADSVPDLNIHLKS